MLDIVAEAIAFFNETRDEQVFDLASVLTWGYVLGPVNQDQVGPATAGSASRASAASRRSCRMKGKGFLKSACRN